MSLSRPMILHHKGLKLEREKYPKFQLFTFAYHLQYIVGIAYLVHSESRQEKKWKRKKHASSFKPSHRQLVELYLISAYQ